MKVLEKGSGQKGWSIKIECTGEGNGDGGCGAKLLVEQPDLFATYNRESFVTFTCCECGVDTDIPEDAWPPAAIRRDIPSKNDRAKRVVEIELEQP